MVPGDVQQVLRQVPQVWLSGYPEFDDIGLGGGRRGCKSNASFCLQDKFAAAHKHLRGAIQGHVGTVGALVDQDNLAAPVLDGCVEPRRAAVLKDDVAAGITTDTDDPGDYVGLDRVAPVK